MENTQTKYYTSKAAAELIGMEVSYLNMLARTKQVESTSVPGKGRTGYIYMFPEATVEKLMEFKELKNNGAKARLKDGGIVVEKEHPKEAPIAEEVSRHLEPKLNKKPRAKKEPIYDRDLALYITKEVTKAYEEGFREGLKHGLEIGKELK